MLKFGRQFFGGFLVFVYLRSFYKSSKLLLGPLQWKIAEVSASRGRKFLFWAPIYAVSSHCRSQASKRVCSSECQTLLKSQDSSEMGGCD